MSTAVEAAIEQERADQVRAKRRELVKRLSALEKRHEKESPPLLEAIEEASGKVAAIREALKEAEDELRTVQQGLQSLNASIGAQTGQLKAQLAETASPQIENFIRSLDVEREELRRMGSEHREERRYTPGEGEHFVCVASTQMSLTRRIQHLLPARTAAENLRYEALSEDELRERLAEIWKDLPVVEMEPV